MIELETPPPSPTLWIGALSPPTAAPIWRIEDSPVRNQPVSRRIRRKKRKRSEPTSVLPEPESHAVGLVETTQDAESYSIVNAFMDTEEIAPTDDDPPVNQADRLYAGYVEAVLADNAPFYQISRQLFVVSGWNVQEGCNNVRWADLMHLRICLMLIQNSWYHLQTTTIGTDVVAVCTCPHGITDQCFHERFLIDFREEKFPDDQTYDGACRYRPALLFFRKF